MRRAAPIIHISGLPFVTQLTTGIGSLIALVVLIIMAYYTFIFYQKYGSIRPVSVGHTEHLEDFMRNQVAKMHENLMIVSHNDKVGRHIEVLSTFFDKTDNKPEYIPANYLLIYIMFMFHEAILNGNSNELSSLRDFFPSFLVSKYYVEGSKTSIGEYSELSRTLHVFDDYRMYIQSEASHISKDTKEDKRIAIHELNLLLNHYFQDILMGYDLRKSGRINSFVIFKVYMRDYTRFVFKETIPDAWQDFSEKVKSTADFMVSYLSTDSVEAYVRALPFTISGVQENFANRVEHFSLGDFFRSIIRLADSLMEISFALMSAITNPIAFLRILIGMLVGVCMYVLYVVLLALSPIFIIPAFVYQGSISALVTVIWTALYCCIACVYLILWIADICTNGFVFSLLRCENLPDAWYKRPGFAYKNAYKRELLCCGPCNDRSLPSNFLCKNIPAYRPSFCPAQRVYASYLESRTNRKHSNKQDRDFTPSTSYYAMHPVDRKQLLGEIYDDKASFDVKCNIAMAPYTGMLRDICMSTKHEEVLAHCRTAFCSTDPTHPIPKYCETPKQIQPHTQEVKLESKLLLSIIFLILLVIFSATMLTGEAL